jgi:hypothetical protein
MNISAAQRSRLYLGLEPILGQESAEVLVGALNFTDTDSIASKADLESLRSDIDHRFEIMMEKLDKKFLNMKIWFLVTGAGIAIGAANLFQN